MAQVIELAVPKKAKTYNIEVTQYLDEVTFTIDRIKVNPESLSNIANALEKMAQIIRTDVVTGAV